MCAPSCHSLTGMCMHRYTQNILFSSGWRHFPFRLTAHRTHFDSWSNYIPHCARKLHTADKHITKFPSLIHNNTLQFSSPFHLSTWKYCADISEASQHSPTYDFHFTDWETEARRGHKWLLQHYIDSLIDPGMEHERADSAFIYTGWVFADPFGTYMRERRIDLIQQSSHLLAGRRLLEASHLCLGKGCLSEEYFEEFARQCSSLGQLGLNLPVMWL